MTDEQARAEIDKWSDRALDMAGRCHTALFWLNVSLLLNIAAALVLGFLLLSLIELKR